MSKINFRKKILKLRRLKYKPQKKIKLSNILKIFKKYKIKRPNVGGYIDVNFEISSIEILKKLEKKKIKISLPVILGNNQMKFSQWSFNQPLKLNRFGIPEPVKCKFVLPNILLVPLVAFDKDKYRIGYGGGYYDRYLAKNQKKRNY